MEQEVFVVVSTPSPELMSSLREKPAYVSGWILDKAGVRKPVLTYMPHGALLYEREPPAAKDARHATEVHKTRNFKVVPGTLSLGT